MSTPSNPYPFEPKGHDEDLATMYATTHQVAQTWYGDAGMSGISADSNTAVNNIQAAIAKAVRSSADGYVKAKRAGSDPRYQQAYNDQEATRLANEADSASAEALKDAEVNLEMLNAFLEDDARPRMKKGEELTARSDLQFALQGANTLQEIDSRLKALASQDNSIGALATDPQTIKLLGMSRGLTPDTVATLTDSVRYAALNAALTSSDSRRQTAAKLRMQTPRLQGAVSSAHTFRRRSRQAATR